MLRSLEKKEGRKDRREGGREGESERGREARRTGRDRSLHSLILAAFWGSRFDLMWTMERPSCYL